MNLHRRTITCVGGVLGMLGTALPLAAQRRQLAKRFLNRGDQKPPGYTHTVVSPPGRMVFISGQGGTDASGKLPDDFATQCTNTFDNLKACLELGGARFEDVVKINYYVTSMSSTEELRRIRARYLNMDKPPAATLVQVAALGKGMLLEIEAIAMIPE